MGLYCIINLSILLKKMKQRKNNWLIYSDGHKEKILNYIYFENQIILFFTCSGTYLYRPIGWYWSNFDVDVIEYNQLKYKPLIIKTSAFYKSRTNYNIDINNEKQWWAQNNIERIELIIKG